MNSIKADPMKVKVLNNYALVEYIDDDLQKNEKIIIVKQNNSSKLRSVYVGRVLDRPDFMYTDAKMKSKFSLDSLVKGESIIAYNPMSIQTEVLWEDKVYHIIRIEDVYCMLDGYEKKEVAVK